MYARCEITHLICLNVTWLSFRPIAVTLELAHFSHSHCLSLVAFILFILLWCKGSQCNRDCSPYECVTRRWGVWGQRSGGASRKLHKGVHGVDWRRSLWTLVALRRVFFLLPAVLADEWAILVELAVSSLAVIHQAVVTVVLLDRTIGWGPAAFQGLVILRITDVKSRDKEEGRILQ